jgi:Fic family protein
MLTAQFVAVFLLFLGQSDIILPMKRKYSAQFVSTYAKAKSLSPSAFEKHYLKAVKDPSTIHFQLRIDAYSCFYHQDSCQNLLVNDLMAKNAELNALLSSLTPLEMSWSQEENLIKEVSASLAIDRIPYSDKEVFEAIHIFHGGTGEAGALSSSYLLIQNGFRFPLNELEDLRHIYDFLMRISLNKIERPDTSLFRMKPIPPGDERLSYIEEASSIKYALKEALSIPLLENLNVFVKLALFDFFFAYAHPFAEGNAKLLRYLDSYFIYQNISPYFAFCLSQCEKESLASLIKGYRSTLNLRNRSDLTTFCNAFLDVLSHEYDEQIYALRRQKQHSLDLRKKYEGAIGEPLLSHLIASAVYLPCGASAYDLASLGEVSTRTVLRALAEEKKKGFIAENPVGKTIHYILKD